MNENKTSDLYLAAYYKVAGIPLVATERDRGTRVLFVFEDQPASVFRELRSQYLMDQAKVPVLSYAQALKALKGLLYAAKDS